MELAIHLLALGGLYVASNQGKSKKEHYTNMGRKINDLPNTNIPPSNYPIMDNKQLIDTVQEYPNPNSATDRYFNQNMYKSNERAGQDVGNNIQQIYSLTGNYLNSNEFNHNNMVPFNGKKPHGQVYNVNNAETFLDNMVGTGSQQIKKVEQAPLFKPEEHVQWAYGAPNMSEFYQSRVNPVMRNNMVKPFESVRVGPGLDKGYESYGSGGYNSGMEARDQWLPKTVDELRVATNPKEEYSLLDHQGPANSTIKNVGVLGKVEKYRPDTYFINSQDRWLTTTGAEKGQRTVAEELFHTSNRSETTTAVTGTPNSAVKTAGYAPTNFEGPKRAELDVTDVPASNARGRAPYAGMDKHLKSHSNTTTNRSVNQQPQTFSSGFSSAIGAVIAPIMDVLNPTRKEEYVCNMRVYGNAEGNVPGNYVHRQGDVPNVTVKETTLHQSRGYVNSQINGTGYQVSPQQPVLNQRDTTNIAQMNGAQTSYGDRNYSADYRQHNNDKLEDAMIRSGRTNQGNMSLLNHDMHMNMSRADCATNWVPPPNSVIATGPSVKTYGAINMPQTYVDINATRLTPDILTAFKDNPYTQSLSSY